MHLRYRKRGIGRPPQSNTICKKRRISAQLYYPETGLCHESSRVRDKHVEILPVDANNNSNVAIKQALIAEHRAYKTSLWMRYKASQRTQSYSQSNEAWVNGTASQPPVRYYKTVSEPLPGNKYYQPSAGNSYYYNSPVRAQPTAGYYATNSPIEMQGRARYYTSDTPVPMQTARQYYSNGSQVALQTRSGPQYCSNDSAMLVHTRSRTQYDSTNQTLAVPSRQQYYINEPNVGMHSKTHYYYSSS